MVGVAGVGVEVPVGGDAGVSEVGDATFGTGRLSITLVIFLIIFSLVNFSISLFLISLSLLVL